MMTETWLATYRTIGTFTFVSPGGNFRFHVIGKGGNGAHGAGHQSYATGGSGGQGGGYAIHEIFMPAGSNATIEIDNVSTVLTYQSQRVIAYGGNNGLPPSGGVNDETKGTALGGNISNTTGAKSTRRNSVYDGGYGGDSVGKYQANGGAGGKGGNFLTNGTSGGSPVNTDTSIGGAGGGGGGEGTSGGSGGIGAIGGVVIEAINSAPTAPAWINAPDKILGGGEAVIQWGAASDHDENLSGYVLERSVNGGPWEELYKGSLREFTNITIMGWNTVQFRVKSYDSDGAESGYISTRVLAVINNTPPTPPSSIHVSDVIRGGSTIIVSWGASTDADNNLKGYTFEQCVDGGEWAQIADTADLTIEVPITFGWQTVQFRVRAYDAYGAVGEYTATGALPVINNRTPTISGEDRDLGTMVDFFERQVFTVNDEDGDAVTVETRLDGIVKNSFTATLGAENVLEIAPEDWRKVANGPHTWTITATDAQGAAATRTITFTKNVTVIRFRLAEPLTADAMLEKFIMSMQGAAPEGSMLTIEVCNNGYDEAPAWEDVTNKVLTGQKHFFRNAAKTAEKWGVSVRVTLDRGAAVGECYIHSHRGNYA